MASAFGPRRSGTAREARHREVEAAPEEMDRADFADKARGKLLQDAVGLHEDPPETMSCIRIVRGVDDVFSEGDGMLQLHRRGMNGHVDTEGSQAALIFAVELRNRLSA